MNFESLPSLHQPTTTTTAVEIHLHLQYLQHGANKCNKPPTEIGINQPWAGSGIAKRAKTKAKTVLATVKLAAKKKKNTNCTQEIIAKIIKFVAWVFCFCSKWEITCFLWLGLLCSELIAFCTPHYDRWNM